MIKTFVIYYFAQLLIMALSYLAFVLTEERPPQRLEAAKLEDIKEAGRYPEKIDKNGFKWDNNLNEWTNTKYVNY